MGDGPRRTAGEVDSALVEVLDDLCFRFLNNLPASEYESFERLFFAVENAHWFYEDIYREQNRKLPKLQLREFSALLFRHSPVLRPYAGNVHALTAQFQSYKKDVPVCGAALLNPEMTKVLLVKGWGPGGKWGFPKGKIAKDESELNTAIREVREETGFDFSRLIGDDAEEPQAIDSYTSGRLCRIFVVHNVPEDTDFKTQTRKEIAKIQWAPIAALPDPRVKNAGAGSDPSISHQDLQQFHEKHFAKAWFVSQYTPKLRSYIKRRRQALVGGGVPTGVGQTRRTDVKQAKSPFKAAAKVAASTASEMESKRSDTHKRRIRDGEDQLTTSTGTASRDLATFGLDGGPLKMTEEERHDLFRTYVEAADKRAAEMGLGDDFWPVPYVTSKDFAPRPGALPDSDNEAKAMTEIPGAEGGLQKASVPAWEAAQSFKFDRDLVLACLM